jgi:hypothetical protein
MAAPTLRIPLGLNMQEFQKNIETAKGHTLQVTQFIVKQFIDMNATILATGGAAGSAVLGFRAILGAIAPLSLAIAGIVGVFKLMGYATELAKEQIEAFNETAEKAGKAGVSTDFFQRYAESAKILKIDIEDAEAALNRFASTAKDKLGGGDIEKRIQELQKAGNFSGNSGVGGFETALGNEDKFKAIVSLIDQALQKGERLAALDIAEKAFGSKVADNLRQDAGYLDKILETSAKISANKLVTDEQIGQAIDLKNRLEEAQKVLSEKFKPIQDDLAKLGVNYHQSWIEVVETMSSAVSKAQEIYDWTKGIRDRLTEAGSADFWDKLTKYSGSLGLNSRPEGLLFKGEPGFDSTSGDSPAVRALRAGLQNPGAVRAATQSTIDVQTAVRGDVSKAPAGVTTQTEDAFDRAIAQAQKRTAQYDAETAAVGLNTEAKIRAKAVADLTTAAQRAGIELTEEQKQKIQQLAEAEGRAAQAAADRTQKLQQQNELLSFSGNQAIGILDGLRNKSLTAADALRNLTNTLITAFEQSLLLGTGPLAGLLGTAAPAGSGKTGGLLGALFGGFRAGGGDVNSGTPYIVGEKGPEWFVPGKSGTIIPNAAVSKNSGGPQVTVVNNLSFSSGVTPTDMAAITSMVKVATAQSEQRTISGIRRGVANDSRFLG